MAKPWKGTVEPTEFDSMQPRKHQKTANVLGQWIPSGCSKIASGCPGVVRGYLERGANAEAWQASLARTQSRVLTIPEMQW